MKYKIIYIFLGLVVVVIVAQLAFIYGLSFVRSVAERAKDNAVSPTTDTESVEYRNVVRFIDRFKNAEGGDVSVRLTLKGKLKSMTFNEDREDYKALFVDENGNKVIEYLYQKDRVPLAIYKNSGEQVSLLELKEDTDVELVIDEHAFDIEKSETVIYVFDRINET